MDHNKEDLIMCIAIWTLYKLCRPLTCAEVRVSPIASRNKLRVTSLLGPIFKDFGSPKFNGLPSSIFQVFFRHYFSMRLNIEFWWIIGGSKTEK